MDTSAAQTGHFRSGDRLALLTVLALCACVLLPVSQFVSYGDEGFHLLAAALVADGQLPYRDFFYQHPPLFPYVYAGWMQLSGMNWQSAHLLSALLSTGTAGLVVQQALLSRATAQATTVMLVFVLLCLHPQFAGQGTVGHPYALAMFLGMAAFRLQVFAAAANRPGLLFGAGVAAGAAVLSSLLMAPLLPLLALWLLCTGERQRRVRAFCLFTAGAALWLLPLGWLYLQASQALVFDLFTYHLRYRGPDFRIPPPMAPLQGLRVLVSWARSWETVPLTLLALYGAWSLRPRAGQPAATAPLLSALLCGALAAFLCTSYPTFSYYFVVLLPFLCLPACQGAGLLCTARWTAHRLGLLVLLTVAVLAVNVLRPAASASAPILRSLPMWPESGRIAALLNARVAPEAPVFAPEHVYFAAGRLPETGLANSFGSELRIAPELATALRVVPDPQIDAWLREGRFAAVVLENGDPRGELLGPAYSAVASDTRQLTLYLRD